MSVLSAACLLFVLAGVGVLKMVLIVVVGAVVGAITVQVVVIGPTIASSLYVLSLPLFCCLDIDSSCMSYHPPENEDKMKVVT